MHIKERLNSGFTLIELMIVMSIITLLMGMVGSLTIDSIEKAQAKSEVLSLKNWLRKMSNESFYTGSAHSIEFAGKQVSVFRGKHTLAIETHDFEYLFFQKQILLYNVNGFTEPEKLQLSYRGASVELDLANIINGQEMHKENDAE